MLCAVALAMKFACREVCGAIGFAPCLDRELSLMGGAFRMAFEPERDTGGVQEEDRDQQARNEFSERHAASIAEETRIGAKHGHKRRREHSVAFSFFAIQYAHF